jgi:hypothetical protein
VGGSVQSAGKVVMFPVFLVRHVGSLGKSSGAEGSPIFAMRLKSQKCGGGVDAISMRQSATSGAMTRGPCQVHVESVIHHHLHLLAEMYKRVMRHSLLHTSVSAKLLLPCIHPP